MVESEHRDCCAPRRADAGIGLARAEPAPVRGRSTAVELIPLDGGWFEMGSDDFYAYEEDGEGPVRSVRVDPFRIGARAVSNREFAEFAAATGHLTSAEHY